jgi:hypothetical protein
LQKVKAAFVITGTLALILAGSANATRVSQAERKAINRTLDAFVDSAVKRQDVAASWNLVTPQLRAGVSRSAWENGNLPVYPYPARGTTFHSWTIDFASRNEVEFELMIPSRLSKSDSIQFTGTMRKLDGRWLVDSFNPAATFSGSGTVVGPHDFAASPGGGGGKGVARLGSAWIALPAVIIAAGLVFLLGWFVYTWVRNWRVRRAYRRPLEPIVVKRGDSEPTLVAKERGQADG